jgi:hypothetical protein
MRFLFASLMILVIVSSGATQSHPIPPGVRQADQAEDRMEKNIPPPVPTHHRVDVERMNREADELAKLSQTIPTDVASIRAGTLPKDLVSKLKQIEKLAKTLQSQLNH